MLRAAVARLTDASRANQTGMPFMSIARSRLRVYYGPENNVATSDAAAADHSVTVTLGEILPHLAEAVRSQRTWLNDFQDDKVTISTDLYEIILAYQHFRRPSA